MRNLFGSTNYWNRVQAWADWKALSNIAVSKGFLEIVKKLTPPENASWRQIDACIAKLRESMKGGEE